MDDVCGGFIPTFMFAMIMFMFLCFLHVHKQPFPQAALPLFSTGC